MSELFLERSAEVLDDWEAVRHDGPRHDAMRWEPAREPRREAVSAQRFLVFSIQVNMGSLIEAVGRMAEHFQWLGEALSGVRLRPGHDPVMAWWVLDDGRIVTDEELARGAKVLPLAVDGRAYRRRRRARARRRR